MRPVTYLRYVLALAFVLAGTGWLTTATAQSFTATGPTPSATPAFRGELEILFDQSDDLTSGLVSQVNVDTPAFDINNADDFVVPEGVTWTVLQVFADGFYSLSPNPNPAGAPQCLTADIGFWSPGDAEPGTPLFLYEDVAPASDDLGALTFSVPATTLESGSYWLSVQCAGSLNFDTTADDGDPVDIRRWNWFRNDNADAEGGAGESATAINPGGGFGFPAPGWNALNTIVTAGFDYNFVLSGTSAGVVLEPELALSPSSLMFDVPSGGSDTETLTISNEGTADLIFSFPAFAVQRRIQELLSRGVNVNSRRFEVSSEQAKGVEPRVYGRDQSTMAQYRVAGPDAFGYVAIDSDEEGGPAYDFIDISDTGTLVDEATVEALGCGIAAGGDEGYALVDLPFTFEFYGAGYDQVYINTNGHLNFNDTKAPPGCGFTNDVMPDVGLPNGGIIAPLWDDFDLRANTDMTDGGQIFYEAVGADDEQVFVVQFDQVEKFGNNGQLNTFQVLLYPNGNIKYQYEDLQSTTLSASIGIENADGTDGLQISRNEAYAVNGLAVLFTQSSQFITGVEPSSGVIAPGMSQDVMVTVDASGDNFGGEPPLSDGSYSDILVLSTNDADEDVVFISAAIEVGGGSGGDIFPEDFEDTAIGEIPEGWARFDNGIGDRQWAVFNNSTLGNVARSQFQNVDDGGDPAEDYLATPQFDVEMGTTLSFDAAETFGFADFGSTFQVLISTTAQTGIENYTVLETYNEDDFPTATDGAATFEIDLSAFAGESVYIAFGHINDDGDDFLLDNVDVTVEMVEDMTIAEARAAGSGAMVTVNGTVSRAKGAFSYFQDDTAGLTIRQTTGAFFDAVAAGTITEGTNIRVTGTLSQFNSLLQINGGDLASFEILGQGEEVEPQMISVLDLLNNGENYEAELVEIDDLTTPSMGVFAASTNYDASDETGLTILRVVGANDSDVDGLPIPDGAFTFEGVVGQFSSADPAVGYQLLAIEEGDVEAQGGGGISLPITFEEDIDYEITPFGGAMSMLAEDPTDASNTVVETTQPEAECFAG
ncbi:MAG: choice-of-anchor J domain-containing protein, partial [Rhodothermales bacterium]